MNHLQGKQTFNLLVAAMTFWLLALVLWSTLTQQARSAQSATHATKAIFTPTRLQSVKTPRQAIAVLKAASLNTRKEQTTHRP